MKRWLMDRISKALITLLLAMIPAFPALSAPLTVQVEGVEGTERQNVINALSIRQLADDEQLPAVARLRYLHHRASAEIASALQPFGYFNPTVHSSLKQTANGWEASYRIDPGPRAHIGKVVVDSRGEASSNPAFTRWMHSPVLQSGAVLDQQAYDQLKSDLLEQASAQGYYAARFTQSEIRVDPSRNLADITLVFDSGPLYRVGSLNFSDSPLGDSLLRRYATLKAGDPVSTDKLLAMQRGLVASDYFRSVEIQPHWEQADSQHQVPIDVKLTPNAQTAYRFGAGYGTDTGARLSARQQRRWLNDKGHSMDTLLRLSEASNTLTLQYQIPGRKPLTDNYIARTSYAQEKTSTTDSTTWIIGAQDQKVRGKQRRSYGLSLEQERYRFGGTTQSTQLLVPEVEWTRVDTDNRLDPTRGYRLNLRVSGADSNLLSDVTFVQAELNTKLVHSLNDKTRLLLRLDAGATAVTDFGKLPSSRRFFAGGDNSVRGYDYKTLGPRDSDGTVRGGRYLLAGSVETDYRVAEHWRAALFVDAGNAFDSLETPLKRSIGIGARWQSPIGPVRIDFAKPLGDNGFRIHFTVGPDL